MAKKKRTKANGKPASERWGPKGARRPSRAQLTALVMATFPDPRSGLPYDTIARRIGALYAPNALKAHVARSINYQGRDELTREYAMCMEAIPDMKISTRRPKFRRDGKIDVDWELVGTHTGSFRGVKPSRKRVRITGTDRFTIKEMLIQKHEVWTNYDSLGWNGIVIGAPQPEKPLFPEDETGTSTRRRRKAKR